MNHFLFVSHLETNFSNQSRDFTGNFHIFIFTIAVHDLKFTFERSKFQRYFAIWKNTSNIYILSSLSVRSNTKKRKRMQYVNNATIKGNESANDKILYLLSILFSASQNSFSIQSILLRKAKETTFFSSFTESCGSLLEAKSVLRCSSYIRVFFSPASL